MTFATSRWWPAISPGPAWNIAAKRCPHAATAAAPRVEAGREAGKGPACRRPRRGRGEARRRSACLCRHGEEFAATGPASRERTMPKLRRSWRSAPTCGATASGRGPILVGPWLSEVGYEVLYWVPFLRWFADHFGVTADRLVVVSRGGVAGWYTGLANRYVELFDLFPPLEFAARNAARQRSGEQKQHGLRTLTPRSWPASARSRGSRPPPSAIPRRCSACCGRSGWGTSRSSICCEHLIYSTVAPLGDAAAGSSRALHGREVLHRRGAARLGGATASSYARWSSASPPSAPSCCSIPACTRRAPRLSLRRRSRRDEPGRARHPADQSRRCRPKSSAARTGSSARVAAWRGSRPCSAPTPSASTTTITF